MAQAPEARGVRRWWGAHRAPSAVYGTIIATSVMAAVDEGTPVGEVAASVVITLIVYWLAERWSVVLGGYLQGGPISLRRVLDTFIEGLPLIEAAYIPLAAMLIAYLSGADDEVSVDIAFGASVMVLFALGARAGRRAGLNAWLVVGSSAFTGMLGIVLAVMKAALD